MQLSPMQPITMGDTRLITMNNDFDFLMTQKRAKACSRPAQLYEIWDEVVTYYEKRLIPEYQYEELREIILPLMVELCPPKPPEDPKPPVKYV